MGTKTTTAFLNARRAPAMRRTFARHIWPWLYMLPAILTFLVWIYIPLAQSAWLSLHEWNLLPTSQPKYVGTQNYERLLGLPEMQKALGNTLIYVLGLIPLAVILPTAIAIYTQDLRGPLKNVYRALIFVPVIIAPVVAAVVWRWLFSPYYGVVNKGIEALGGRAVDFLNHPSFAIWTIIWITGWKFIGFSTLILSAANAGINRSYIEAAQVDGATTWQIIRHIRLPLLSPTIMLLTILTLLLGAQWSFTYINVLTPGGGQLNSTTNIFYLLWEFGFGSLAVGWASAAGTILFVGFSILAFVLFRIMAKVAVYDN